MYLQKHQQFANFFIVPIFAFISSKIYEDSKYNYAEHFSIFLYAVSLSLLISSSIGILFGLFNSEYLENVYHYINYFLSFVVVTWIAYKSYEEGFSYAIGVYFLSYIFYFFSLMVLFFIFIN